MENGIANAKDINLMNLNGYSERNFWRDVIKRALKDSSEANATRIAFPNFARGSFNKTNE